MGPGVTPEERYADYEVYDQNGQRIGPISDLFVDDSDEPEYVGVEPGTLTDRSVLVPAEVISINDGLRRMVVSPEETGGIGTASRVAAREDDEVTVRRSEEELLVGRREREAGTMRIRKRVRTETEHLEVPKKRVEVTVERVPVDEPHSVEEGITATPQIEEEDIVVPVVEEEVVVEKRPVVKEEIRIRKRVVEDVEIVEEDVRKEEVEIDDQTHREKDL
jgi:uncharacterized protein (TIGR02271 family)